MQRKQTTSLSAAVLDFLKKDEHAVGTEFSNQVLKGYLKKDLNGIYSFIDNDCSVKLYFNPNYIEQYTESLPSNVTIDDLDSKYLN